MNILLRHRLALITLIAVTQIFSPVLVVPGAGNLGGSVFRLLLLAVSGSLALTTGFGTLSPNARRALTAAGLLSVWMLTALAWSSDLALGARQLSYVITIVLMLYTFDLLIVSKRDIHFVAALLTLLGLGVAALSFYELNTGQHFFPSQIQEMAELNASLRYMVEGLAWFTFGNPNDLSVHLTICSFMSIFLAKKSIMRLCFIAITCLSIIYLSYELGARISVAAAAIFIVLTLVGYMQGRSRSNFFLATGTIIVGAALAAAAIAISFNVEFIDVSSFIRLQLLNSAMSMALGTFLVGVGTGGFNYEMLASGYTGLTYSIVDPHNAIGRMLAENGVVGVWLFGYLLLGPLKSLAQDKGSSRYSVFVAASVVAMPLLLSQGSDPLSSSSLQLAIALMWTFSRFVDEADGLLIASSANFEVSQDDNPLHHRSSEG